MSGNQGLTRAIGVDEKKFNGPLSVRPVCAEGALGLRWLDTALSGRKRRRAGAVQGSLRSQLPVRTGCHWFVVWTDSGSLILSFEYTAG